MAKKVRAQFTVEAVFVMPIVLFAIVAVIYISFYLYDYCRIQATTDLLLHKAVLNLNHEVDIESGKIFYEDIGKQGIFYQVFGISDTKLNYIGNLLAEKLSRGLLATEIRDIKVSASMSKVAIYVEGEFRIPIKGAADLLFRKRTVIVEAERERHNPANTVRISEVILQSGSKIKGLDKLKENLEKLQQIP